MESKKKSFPKRNSNDASSACTGKRPRDRARVARVEWTQVRWKKRLYYYRSIYLLRRFTRPLYVHAEPRSVSFPPPLFIPQPSSSSSSLRVRRTEMIALNARWPVTRPDGAQPALPRDPSHGRRTPVVRNGVAVHFVPTRNSVEGTSPKDKWTVGLSYVCVNATSLWLEWVSGERFIIIQR